MPPKRKYLFSPASQGGRKNPRLVPRFQGKGETEEEELPADFSGPSSLLPRTTEHVRKTVEGKIEYGKKLVFRALKKAKGFEKQKLVKRLRIARENSEDLAVKKLELEFEVLKTEEIDLKHLASNHISKTLFKYRSISSSPLFPPWLAPPKEPEVRLNERETARRNIIARLYNSNPVKETIKGVVGNVKSVMGMDEGKAIMGETETEIEAKVVGDDKGHDSVDGEEGEEEEAVKTVRLATETKVVDETSGEEDGEEKEEEEWGGIADSGMSEDPDLDAFADNFEDRIAGSSDEDEGQVPLQRGIGDEWSGGEEQDEDDGEEEEGEEDDGGEDDPQDVELAVRKAKSESKSRSKPKDRPEDASSPKPKRSEKPQLISSAKSTFLSTLMSGYISGSDSDSNIDYYKARNKKKGSPVQPKERKNRMGQQARRTLWEKKFGKNANHVKKDEEEQGREKVEQRIKQGRGGEGKNKKSESGAKKSTEAEGPLHPSWEAARKAKEQQARVQEAVMGKPMGKKIVFD